MIRSRVFEICEIQIFEQGSFTQRSLRIRIFSIRQENEFQ